jgi:hypothetical protein
LYFKSFDGHLDAGGKVIDRNVEVSLALTKITSCAIPETVTVQRRGNYNHEDDTIFDVTSVGKGAFYGCDSLESVTFPDRLTNIGSYAFYGCAELDEIVLPSGLASIGNWAFVGCDDLRKVICLGETPPAIRDVFEDRPVFLFPEDQGVIVFVPNEKAVAAYEAAWRKYLTDNVLIAALEQTK